MNHFPEAVAAISLFLGLPWLIFHYVTKWKTAPALTNADERAIEELYELARRLGERVRTVERIVTAENSGWREIACEAPESAIEQSNETLRRIK